MIDAAFERVRIVGTAGGNNFSVGGADESNFVHGVEFGHADFALPGTTSVGTEADIALEVAVRARMVATEGQ